MDPSRPPTRSSSVRASIRRHPRQKRVQPRLCMPGLLARQFGVRPMPGSTTRGEHAPQVGSVTANGGAADHLRYSTRVLCPHAVCPSPERAAGAAGAFSGVHGVRGFPARLPQPEDHHDQPGLRQRSLLTGRPTRLTWARPSTSRASSPHRADAGPFSPPSGRSWPPSAASRYRGGTIACAAVLRRYQLEANYVLSRISTRSNERDPFNRSSSTRGLGKDLGLPP